jgi:Asp-tRNA(Asn)/Glu-tRNA(Gln) amidotransferase B subunit
MRVEPCVVGGASAKQLVEERGLKQISDPAEIQAIVDKVLAANPGPLEQYWGGKVGRRRLTLSNPC